MTKLHPPDRLLAQRLGTQFMAIVLLSAIGTTQLTQRSLAHRPLLIAQTNPSEQKAEADRLLNQGKEQFNTSQFEAALQSWQQSLAIYRQLQDRLGEGRSLGNLGAAYYSLGDYPTAIDYQQQRLAIAREIKDRLGEEAALGNLGNVYYSLGNYPKAIEYQQQSLAIAREIQDRLGKGQSLGNLGAVYQALGDYPKAVEYHQQFLVIARELKDRLGEGQSLNNLGNAYDSLGDYSKAIEYYKQSLEIAREIKNRTGEGSSLNNLGIIYYSLKDYSKAIEYYKQSLEIAREIKDRTREGSSLNNLGNAYYALGMHLKAVEYHRQSLAIAREIKDRKGEGSSLINLGYVYNSLGDYSKAIEYHKQGLAIAREIKDRSGEGISLNNLGVALINASQLIEAASRLLASQGISRLALINAGRLAEAEAALRNSIEVSESLRVNLTDSQKVSIFDTQRNAYNNLQRALIAQKKVTQALEVAERGRARAFVELLAQNRQTSDNALPGAVSPPTLAEIQQIAQSHQATLVEYSVIADKTSADKLYIWVVQPNGQITFREVSLKSLTLPLATLVENTRVATAVGEASTRVSRANRFIPFNAQAAEAYPVALPPAPAPNLQLHQLHQLLIAPIADLLPSDPTQRVIFIPHESLFLVPFPALADDQGRSLIEKHTLLLAPSIQALQFTQQRRVAIGSGKLNRSALVVGNPTMPNQLPSLPYAAQEAKAVAAMLGVPFLTGDQATKAAVKAKMGTARIIHFATHGSYDSQQGLASYLAFAPTGQDSGLLSAGEVLATFGTAPGQLLQATLVVLSACDTGRGKISGDGVIGLSRSFLSAGVPSVVVSLWGVQDDSTAFLMQAFYGNLQQGMDKAQALRQAMLTTKEQYPDPAQWAAFMLVGEAE